jgi:hypothetical protein
MRRLTIDNLIETLKLGLRQLTFGGKTNYDNEAALEQRRLLQHRIDQALALFDQMPYPDGCDGNASNSYRVT